MADYRRMYYLLFNKITDVISDLQAIQQIAEEIYIKHEEQIVEIPVSRKEKKDSVPPIHTD